LAISVGPVEVVIVSRLAQLVTRARSLVLSSCVVALTVACGGGRAWAQADGPQVSVTLP
jgi:hypothetical protein